jgi:hypothetical protein
LSASFLLAGRAAFELDIDPEEFDVLDPRRYSNDDLDRPLLHITDHLVNGAGYCTWMAQTDNGKPRVTRLIESMLEDEGAYPLCEFLDAEHNACDTSCYRCMRRYRNQPYHGLLDWQLGLAYLRAMVDPTFDAGAIQGDFERYPELRRWPKVAMEEAAKMQDRFSGETATFSNVPAFRIKLRGRLMSPWVLVRHPLWEWHPETGPVEGSLMGRAYAQAQEYGPPLTCDTFNLLRRPVSVRTRLALSCAGR